MIGGDGIVHSCLPSWSLERVGRTGSHGDQNEQGPLERNWGFRLEMALWLKYYALRMVIMLFLSSLASPSLSYRQTNPFLHDLQLQCPTTIVYSWPIELNGESLEKVLSSNQMNMYVAILFYASWCPFSRSLQSNFDALSSMFPQIKHVTVEQSSVPPIVFSKHGIHSVPSILLVNRTTRMRFHGPKDLHSVLHFYQKATGPSCCDEGVKSHKT
ncbi:hypothetical protein E3N88_14882 [Mikania micrantha]|uniref:Thioredoxin domain-containing protein n=1 Tax=Mikania micrantha TaxID=192012 RepID=A0A5N6P2Z5_9ASTR|nr:hypothetical protein E3N88_14882 [Mikania micrantha]